MANHSRSERAKALAHHDGNAVATVHPDVTEKEIYEDREIIVMHLDAAYLRLLDGMEEFQQQWSNNPLSALYFSWEQGKHDGMQEWAGDQGELFKAETWTHLGEKAKEWTGGVYDRLYGYVIERHQDFAKNYSVVTDNPDGTILNWAWWKTVIEDKTNEAIDAQKKRAEEALHRVDEAIHETSENLARIKRIYQHREDIYKIPELIANGDGAAIIAFIKGPLKDIDPQLSEAVLQNEELHDAIAVVQDHDSLLTYLAYIMLMIEAVPPNFYVYITGKGATYIGLELVLNIVLGLLTDGTFVAARVAMLTARYASMGARAANTARKIEKAANAIKHFNQTLDEYLECCNKLRDLGKKLRAARSKSLVGRGQTKETIHVRQSNVKRDIKCKCCGSTHHKSPRTAGNSILVYR